MNDTKIGIIMTTFNREKFLSSSIEAILFQTYKNIEFILVNNGSTDESHKICKYYAEKDSRIKVIFIENNNGPMEGKIRGLQATNCDYVAFIDDDDVCEPTMIEFLWELLDNNDADIAICGSWYDLNGKKEPKYVFDNSYIYNRAEALEELLKREKFNVAPPTKLFRKALFDGVHFKQNVRVDDIHFMYRVFANANIIAAHGKPLYSFVKHSSNLTAFTTSTVISPELLAEYLDAFQERTRFLSNRVESIIDRVRYSEWSFMLSMCDKIKLLNDENYKRLYVRMQSSLRNNVEEILSSEYLTTRELLLIEEHEINSIPQK